MDFVYSHSEAWLSAETSMSLCEIFFLRNWKLGCPRRKYKHLCAFSGNGL